MMPAPRQLPRKWTEEEDQIIREERVAGTKTWAYSAAARLKGRTPDMCWSRDKSMRDREILGEVVTDRFSSSPWSNLIDEESHLDQLIEAGGFPQFKVDPSTGLMTRQLVDQWGYAWNPA